MAKLRAVGPDLYLGDEPLRGHIGFNSFYPFEEGFTLGTTTWQQAIDAASAVGAKVMRVPISVRYKNDLQTYVWTYSAPTYTLRSTYTTLVTSMLDYAASKGVSLLVVPFWRRLDPADVAGETGNQLGIPTSNARGYCRQILAQMIAAFSAHTALAGWCISNEGDILAWGMSTPTDVNASKGTPASYTSADAISMGALESWYKECTSQIKTADPDAFVINGHGGPVSGGSGQRWWAHQRLRYPRCLDAVSAHPYITSEGTTDDPESMGIWARRMLTWAGNRPVIFDEMGAQASGSSLTAANDPNGTLIARIYAAFRGAGVPLMLEWQLCPVARDSQWGIWPNEDRGNQRLELVRSLNSGRASGYSRPLLLREMPSTKRFASFSGTGLLTVADTALHRPESFTVMCWLKHFGLHASIYRRIVSKAAGSPNRGWRFILPSSAGAASISGQVYGSLLADNAGTPVDMNDSNTGMVQRIGRWQHHAMTWDGLNLWVYIDGIPYGSARTLTAGHTYTHYSGPMYLGGDNAGSPHIGGLADVRLYGRVLSHEEVIAAMNGGSAPGLIGWWPLDGDGDDYSGYGNHATGSPDAWAEVMPLRNTRAA